MISLIDAGPGTGKTYSLVYGYLSLRKQIMGQMDHTDEQKDIFQYITSEFPQTATVAFFTHSNTVKDTLEKRLGKKGPKVYTFHGAGLSNIIKRFGFQKPTFNRMEKHIEILSGLSLSSMPWSTKLEWLGIKKIVNYLKMECLDPNEESLEYLMLKYPDMSTIQIPDHWAKECTDLLSMAASPDGEVDYNDMVYVGKKVLTRPRFLLGFVDESQDISRASYQLVTRMCEHVIMCGDKNQAIDAWRGASEEMYNQIASVADAVLPLKVTQRCPKIICDLANQLRPNGVIHGPNTLPGCSTSVRIDSLPEMLGGTAINPTNSLFISRTNAYVINFALHLHKMDIPCQIIDKDLATELKDFIKMFKVGTLPALDVKLNEYIRRNDKARNKLWSFICREKVESVRAFMADADSVSDMFQIIDEVVRPNKNGYKCTTVHKAKGLEARNIFIINSPIEIQEAMDHPIAKEQETNIHFVAITRSAENLYWITR